MIKRIKLPEPITLEDYCDENDLTILVTSYKDAEGGQLYRAEIEGSFSFEINGSEQSALIRLVKLISRKTIIINGRIHKFPI